MGPCPPPTLTTIGLKLYGLSLLSMSVEQTLRGLTLTHSVIVIVQAMAYYNEPDPLRVPGALYEAHVEVAHDVKAAAGVVRVTVTPSP